VGFDDLAGLRVVRRSLPKPSNGTSSAGVVASPAFIITTTWAKAERQARTSPASAPLRGSHSRRAWVASAARLPPYHVGSSSPTKPSAVAMSWPSDHAADLADRPNAAFDALDIASASSAAVRDRNGLPALDADIALALDGARRGNHDLLADFAASVEAR
jgi:hypothetical protein